MCGRFALNRGLGQLRAAVNANQVVANGRSFNPSNNIAPGSAAPVVHAQNIQVLAWGSERFQHTLINARSETVAQKFTDDVRNRRCVVPVDGYFEWDKTKQPHFFRHPTDGLMFLAGLFNKRGEFLILTRDAVAPYTGIHHRMPIIFTLEQIPLWEGPHWGEMLGDKPPTLTFYAVSRVSMRSGYTGEDCVRPLKAITGQQTELDEMLKQRTNRKIQEMF
jgi:putative SOS response-associated peptidase YedK